MEALVKGCGRILAPHTSAERRFGRENDTQDAVADEENAITLRKAKAEAAQRMKEIDLEFCGKTPNAEPTRRTQSMRCGARNSMPAVSPGW